MTGPPRVHIVVHINEPATAVEQSQLVVDAGFDSVFLIDHHSRNHHVLFGTVAAVQARFGDLAVGVNLLLRDPAEAAAQVDAALELGVVDRVDALWCDDITGGFGDADTPAVTRRLMQGGQLGGVDLFGGVAFKYTSRYTDDPEAAADEARMFAGYVDVVTTSGPGTNKTASVDKIAAVAQAVPAGKRVALASGVSPENVAEYAPWCTDVLVASSLETVPYSGQLRPDRLAAMHAAITDLTDTTIVTEKDF